MLVHESMSGQKNYLSGIRWKSSLLNSQFCSESKFLLNFSKFAMAFVGKYERTSADNYDEFLKALDVNFLLRKAATVSTPVMEVTDLLTLDAGFVGPDIK